MADDDFRLATNEGDSSDRLDTSAALRRTNASTSMSRLYTTGGSIDLSLAYESSKALLAAKSEEPEEGGSVYNWSKVVTLTAISSLSGLCFGYDTAVISGATLYFEDTFPDITHG